MLFFSKPKKRLADIIPPGYTDIHSHLLPGIDDGSKNADDTSGLIATLKEYGFSGFITTPHILTGVWNNTREGILQTEAQNSHLFTEAGVPVRAAAEYLIDDNFAALIKTDKLLTLKDDYVLVEMSYLNAPIALYQILFALQMAGYKPILAHPERYLFYFNNIDEYRKLKKAGCKFQLNLLSVTGYYGKPVLDNAQMLLDNGMIDFTGSDVHHARHAESIKSVLQIKKHDRLKAALKNNTFFNF